MKRTPQKVQRQRLSDQVAERLIAMIASGELQPGEKLPPEPQLVEQFGVGRSSIREAVGALELVGVLSVRPGVGTRVMDSTAMAPPKAVGLSLLTIGREKVADLVEARIELEQAIAKYAAMRASPADVEAITRQQANFLQAKQQGRTLIDADIAFHEAVANASHNTVLIRLLAELRPPVRLWMEQKAKYDWGFAQVAEEHAAIVEAIVNRDADAAQAVMRAHIEKAGEKLIAAMGGA